MTLFSSGPGLKRVYACDLPAVVCMVANFLRRYRQIIECFPFPLTVHISIDLSVSGQGQANANEHRHVQF
ncbi:MAG: hypothetical protein KDB01_03950, partial [Planctomycetaceae bacterium]|nr:hypothetical protein [Planctomycetaceae bacterium]